MGGGEAADACVDSAGSERKHEELPETQDEPDSYMYEVSPIYAPKGGGSHRGESNLSVERDGNPLDWRTDLDAASSVTIDDLKLVKSRGRAGATIASGSNMTNSPKELSRTNGTTTTAR